LPVDTAEGWTPNGVPPNVEWIFGAKPAFWGSWSGAGERAGTLVLGPFRAPRRFLLAACGFPKEAGTVFLRRHSDGAMHALWLTDTGHKWSEFAFVVPSDWIGEQVELCAMDTSTNAPGWFGLSEPYNRGLAADLRPYWEDTSVPKVTPNTWPRLIPALLLSAAVLLAPGIALWPLVRRRFRLPEEVALLVAIALSALTGYVIFWVYFFSPASGPIASWAVLLLALGTMAYRRWRGQALGQILGGLEVGWPAALMAGIGFFYVGILMLPRQKGEISFAAQRRWFQSSLPSDNTLPQLLAEKVASGEQLRPVLYLDWQTSDRPPLQAGWQLLGRAPLRILLGSEPNATDMRNQVAGIIFQLAWVPALWAFLRVTGLSRTRSYLLILSLAPAGFLLVNSVYVWPKLSAAAFTVGAFVLLAPRARARPCLGAVIAGSGMAALAYLSHGAAIFALVGLGLVLATPRYFLGWKYALIGIAVFLLLNLPWLTFQKFYDPPGDRLIKWHLGGSTIIDSRGVLETIKTSYRVVGLGGAIEKKKENVLALFGGNFRDLINLGGKEATSRRSDEFYFIFRSVGWWNVGWIVGLSILLRKRWRAWDRKQTRDYLAINGQILGVTSLLWVLLMFGPATTVIHQGSYYVPLMLLTLPAVILMRVHVLLWAVIAVFNATVFFATYLPGVRGGLDWAAMGVAGVSGLALLTMAFWLSRNNLQSQNCNSAGPRENPA
jgi:hypothetical protein